MNQGFIDMKKLALTIAITLSLGLGVYAQGGLFQYGALLGNSQFEIIILQHKAT